MSQFEIRKAERRNLKLRLGIAGPSGGGKTKSSLRIMRGLLGPKGRIVVLDTEQSSSEMYAHDPEIATELQPTGFDVVPLAAPYSPERYMAALDFIEKLPLEAEGFEGLGIIADQISNAWAGPGGVLEFVDQQKWGNGQTKGFSAWKDATPMQHRFVERLLRVNGDLIVTMRSRVEWVIDKNDKGKSEPRKVGLSPVQREGIEYEFQIMLDAAEGGNAAVSKDRTGLFFGTVFKPTPATGVAIREFFASGKALKPQTGAEPAPPAPTAGEPANDGGEYVPDTAPHALGDDSPASPAPAAPSEPLLDKDAQKVVIGAAKKAGMGQSDFKAFLKTTLGVEKLDAVPVSKLAFLMSEIGKRKAA